MSKSRKKSERGRERRISVRGIRRESPDMRKLSRALLDIAAAQAEAAAQAQIEAEKRRDRPEHTDA